MQARGEPVVDLVHQRDRLVEGRRRHDPQDRPEVLGAVELGAAAHAVAHARAPQPAGVVEPVWLEQPALARAERRQAAEQLAPGGLDHRAHPRGRVGRVADREGGDRVEQLRAEPRRAGDGADQHHERGGRALLSGVPEGARHHVLHREVEIGRGRDDDRVLAAGLGEQRQVVAERAEQLCCLVGAGEDHAVHRGGGDQVPSQLLLRQTEQSQRLAGHSRRPQRLGHHGTAARGGTCGLEHHSGAGGQRGEYAAGRYRHREVPRRSDQRQRRRVEAGAVDRVELAGALGVVVREVHGLRDLGVALVDRLAALGRHHLQQFGSARLQLVAGAVQDAGALVGRHAAPAARASSGEHRLQLAAGGDRGGLDRLDACARGGDAREDPLRPLAFARRRVGVGCAAEVAEPRAAARGEPVGHAMRGRHRCVEAGDGGAEPLLLPREERRVGLELEDGRHEVLARRPLLQPADQVAIATSNSAGATTGV
ncbi:hypothetical protein ACH61_02765 [Rathayibacter tanaceti]|uniref:Uncharacterized protein n=1 Tax=Rathayibacter tanaceti TaxID=1671680 RepID=A0A162FVG3_9MICO|nr:hypothetical protein ACH61_02765 [Rathayibacter tanaceti]